MAISEREHFPAREVCDGEWAALRNRLRGELVLQQDADYDETRRGFNGLIVRRPLAIVRCAGPDDAVVTIDFAHRHDLPLILRGGGHGMADGGLTIDCSPMKVVSVDLERQVATAGAGLWHGEFIEGTERRGLASTWLALLAARRIGG